MTATTPEEYIAQVDEPKRTELQTLHDFIRKTAPHLEPYMEKGMIGYGPFRYKYTSGKQGEWCRVGLAANKTGISVHIVTTDENGHLAEQARARLGKANIGRSCIRFKKLADINLPALEELIRMVPADSQAAFT